MTSDNETEDNSFIRRSNRRQAVSSQKADRLKALATMKEARRNGTAYRQNVDDLVQNVYDVVDEEEYSEIVKKRQKDDFVVDDDGSGYVDHGIDFLEEDEEEEEQRTRNKKEKKEKPKRGTLTNFFSAVTNVRKTTADESKVKIDDDDDLKDILKDIDEPVEEEDYEDDRTVHELVSRNPFKRDRQTSPDIAPRPVKVARIQTIGKRSTKIVNPSPIEQRLNEEENEQNIKLEQTDEGCTQDDHGSLDNDWSMDCDTVAPQQTTDQPKEVKKEIIVEEEKKTTKLNKGDHHLFKGTQWEEETEEKSETLTESAVGEQLFYTKNDEGIPVVRMYWCDAFEDAQKHAGTVYLYGRLQCTTNNYESGCIVVKNISREIFFIPRETLICDGESSNDPVTMDDVREEVNTLMRQQFFIKDYKWRVVKRRVMNCENNGQSSDEIDVLQIIYDSSFVRIPIDLTGATFRSVENTTTTALERLLMEREFMGPGWIDISNYVESAAKVSYSAYEFTVDMQSMKSITYLKNQFNPPPVKLMALNILTTLNEKKDNEICIISCLFNPRCNLNQPSTEQKDLQRMTFVCHPPSAALPYDIKDKLKKENMDGFVHTCVNERVLLNMFLTKMQNLDPDIVLGHDISSTIGRLMARIEKHKVPSWSRMSRLKRSAALNKIGHSKSAQWELTAGRLLVDSKTCAMELVRCRSYELDELSSSILKTSHETIFANEVASKYSNSQQLLNLIRWSWMDPFLSLRIIAHLNALPLAIQITNIVGGVASRTLLGGRAERNEYLLLHSFKRANIIPPNKFQPSYKKGNTHHNKKQVKSEDTEGNEEKEGEEGETEGRKKAQYSGGLVLEPKKGLYDTMILLLDFNSLYPSIIQEFNICFSTVQYNNKDGDELPELPDSTLSEGILPREIRGLVERRRQVKSLMKNVKSEVEKKQYDIRQMALKLTANSMYGCLGFQQSRFYAKPLAALVTAKGREILLHTKDLVEKLGYSVIYGDTDSIMINTNSTDLKHVKKLGYEIKQQVNRCHKLLELDLDGVFKRLLLLKKKKYAALTVNVDDEKEEKKELKGLDIVRRDWSMLAKEQGSCVVDLILDCSLSREELVAEIHESLRNLRERIDGGKVETEQFEILKQLTRDPRDYADPKGQPHVSVAIRLNNTGKFHLKQGDIVRYVVCEDGTNNSAIQRAYHRTELEMNPSLKIDLHYYLAQQIHPVISRLCAPIEETDPVRIAEALGMDSSSYRRTVASSQSNVDNELVWNGVESFEHCTPLIINCPKCSHKNEIRTALQIESSSVGSPLETCSSCSASLLSNCAFLVNQLTSQLDLFTEKLMKSCFVCDDQVCAYRTRIHGMRWSREGVECPKCCGGIMKREYSEKELFEQQSFFKKCVDIEKAKEELSGDAKKHSLNHPSMTMLSAVSRSLVEECNLYLSRNAYSRVNLAFLFAPMCKLN